LVMFFEDIRSERQLQYRLFRSCRKQH
jgi:hypothetical protein